MLTKWKVPYGDVDLFMDFDEWKELDIRVNTGDYMYSKFMVTKGRGVYQYVYLKGARPLTAYKVIRNFDLTICQVAVHQGKLYMTEQAKHDIENWQFHVIPRNVVRGHTTYRRVQKYKKRGFKFKGELEDLDVILGVAKESERIRWS
jgi:hypothetical protein